MRQIMRTRDADSVTGLAEFWEVGHKLFKSSPGSSPITFVAGDVFDPAHLETVPPFTTSSDAPRPHLPTLTSLNPLRGHVSAVHKGELPQSRHIGIRKQVHSEPCRTGVRPVAEIDDVVRTTGL